MGVGQPKDWHGWGGRWAGTEGGGGGEGWIHVSPGTGTAPGAVTVSLSGTGGYGVGTYQGQVEVTVGETGIEYGVPVRLIVAPRLTTVYLPVVAR